MKTGLHPENYRLVVFKDMSNNDVFITKSTAETKETIKVDGVEYPLVKLEISRTSHPYYTGKSKLVDTAGRIDKFKNRYSNLTKKDDNKESEEKNIADNTVDNQSQQSDKRSTENDNIVQKSNKEDQASIEEESKSKLEDDSISSESNNVKKASEGDLKKDDETSIIEDSKDESTNDSQSDESSTSEQNPELKK
tara:strand:+ start:17636 stop:18217 length:582 start_codon:yes stop_codon:yes gene_type:complete